jgi:integrase/recombinase XerC
MKPVCDTIELQEDAMHEITTATPTALTPDVADLLGAFLSRRSATTRRAYDADLRAFAAFAGLSSAAEGLRHLVALGKGRGNVEALRYVEALRAAGLASATINRRLSALRSALKLARTLGMVDWTIEVEALRARAYRDTKGPGTAGVARLLAEARAQSPPLAARDVAILRLLFDCGLRRGELVGLDVAHLDGDRLAVQGKGHTDREPVTLPAPTRAALAAWLSVRGTLPGPLFGRLDRAATGGRLTGEAIRRLVARLGERADLGIVRPHGLRHAAITAALDAGETLRAVQRFARHADPRTTIKYDDNHHDLAGKVAVAVAAAVA